MEVGFLFACGAREKKQLVWLQERASAIVVSSNEKQDFEESQYLWMLC